jgi:hypothetical protein
LLHLENQNELIIQILKHIQESKKWSFDKYLNHLSLVVNNLSCNNIDKAWLPFCINQTNKIKKRLLWFSNVLLNELRFS